jgi:hypothetical protein
VAVDSFLLNCGFSIELKKFNKKYMDKPEVIFYFLEKALNVSSYFTPEVLLSNEYSEVINTPYSYFTSKNLIPVIKNAELMAALFP